MQRKPVIGVMGGSTVSSKVTREAYELGQQIAKNGWVLLNGGRDAGVMRASAEGAKSKNGLTLGILMGASKHQANPYIDIPICTNMGDARNVINVLSSDIIVACPGSAGTLSEIALALKNNKTVISLHTPVPSVIEEYESAGQFILVHSVSECIEEIEAWLNESQLKI
ncbi:MAG: TIGR00725 family protein [candidate division KSB1 bacterium]|nr:TIGR00725 family protein [candidate division KSB1 bacterium]